MSARDLSALPSATRAASGHPPDAVARFMPKLAEAWHAKYLADGNASREFAVEGTRFRASWAGSCTRRLAYDMLGYKPTNPTTIADSWRFGIGSLVHEEVQKVMLDAFPGASVEVTVDLRDVDLDGSAHVDIVITQDIPRWVTVIELKTISGYGMKMAIGARGTAEGPRTNAILQGALTAYALDADELVIGYLSLENLSPRELTKLGPHKTEVDRFAAEWTFTRDEYQPLAQAEIERVNAVMATVDAGLLPLRMIPDLPAGAQVTDPAKGMWQVRDAAGAVLDAGNTWVCPSYCGHRDRCIADGAIAKIDGPK